MTDMNEQAFWRACEPLKEEGMNIANYLDQLSGILFLKACDASGKVTFEDIRDGGLELPSEYRWDSIIQQNDPEERLEKYEQAMEYLKHKNGEVSREAFKGFTPQFETPSKFSRTVDIVEGIDGWDNYDENADIFGDAHEFLLEKYADKAEGAGEYFTPRPLVNTMVRVTDPSVDESIIDPAAGTNGFLVSSYNYMKKNTDDFDEVGDSVEYMLHSREIQRETYRLGLMNYILHDIDPVTVDSMCEDSLQGEGNREEKYDIVLANPPFGPEVTTKYDPRCDSKIETNFLMMMIDLLDQGGRAAIVVPEGILFDGAKEVVREELLNYCNLDTILALPENTFQPYAGVDANVLFFEKDNDGTDEFWYYDARSDYYPIYDNNPLSIDEHFADLIENYDSDEDREEVDEFFKVSRDEVDEENHELHLKKYKEFKYEGHRPPAEIAQDIKDELVTIETELDQMVGENDD